MATMATVSTVTGRYSRTSPTCNGKQLNGINTTSEGSSVDHLSDVWPRHSTHHPPSPPVRQRARYQPFSFYFSFFSFFLSLFVYLFIHLFIYMYSKSYSKEYEITRKKHKVSEILQKFSENLKLENFGKPLKNVETFSENFSLNIVEKYKKNLLKSIYSLVRGCKVARLRFWMWCVFQ